MCQQDRRVAIYWAGETTLVRSEGDRIRCDSNGLSGIPQNIRCSSNSKAFWREAALRSGFSCPPSQRPPIRWYDRHPGRSAYDTGRPRLCPRRWTDWLPQCRL